jgi:hypothetical protein
MTKRQEMLMGREVGKVARQLSQALGCGTCGIGKAVDIVGQRWGLVPYDWAGEEARRAGEHICQNTTWNLTRQPTRKINPSEWAATHGYGVGVLPTATVITDAEKNARCREIEEQLAEWARREEDEGRLPDVEPDSRLPVERDYGDVSQ